LTASETPGEQSGPAHRHDDRVKVRDLPNDLESHGALAGDDRRIVVAVDVGEAFLSRDLVGASLGFGKILSMQDDSRAQFLTIVDFDQGRELRHHHRGRYA
jgi:hypothetical protein